MRVAERGSVSSEGESRHGWGASCTFPTTAGFLRKPIMWSRAPRCNVIFDNFQSVFFRNGFGREALVPVITDLFDRLKKTGFHVIIGVSGHNVQGQIAIDQQGART